MSEKDSSTGTPSLDFDDPEDHELVPSPRTDWLLQAMVRIFNSLGEGSGFGITLFVKGLTVSGIAVGYKDYFKGVSEEIKSSSTSDDPETSRIFASIFELALEEQLKQPTNVYPEQPPAFIHLKEAQFITGERSLPTNRGIWWRGRISEVDGFFIGSLNPL